MGWRLQNEFLVDSNSGDWNSILVQYKDEEQRDNKILYENLGNVFNVYFWSNQSKNTFFWLESDIRLQVFYNPVPWKDYNPGQLKEVL